MSTQNEQSSDCTFCLLMVYLSMSAEKIILQEQNSPLLGASVESKNKISGRVDINCLIARVRKEKQRQKKNNLIIVGLFAFIFSVIAVFISF